ncbi:MAG: CotH kinase family protein, partial [Pirellulales bacterium]
YVDPKEADVTPRQTAWIRDYFGRMYASLTDTNPETGYAQFIDVDSWIDHHIINVLALNVDALRLSTYFFKDRGGKLEFGPVWDFDRSMESNDPRDDRPNAWGNASFFGDPWWKELFQDPVFEQRWWDRWYELRQGVLSNENINVVIDSMASQLTEVQRRNFERWPASRPRTSAQTNYKSGELDGSWQGEVDHMRKWLMTRVAWIDSQSIGPPAIEPAPGRLAVGEQIGFLADTDVVYYTLDGSDPRSADGQINPAAVVYNDSVDFFSDDDPLRYRIPTGAAGEADWQAADFDDSEWNSATGGLGFDTGIDDPSVRLPSGFTVRQVVSSSVVADLNTADGVLAGNDVIGEITETGVPTINYLSPQFQPTAGQARQDHFAADRELPNGGGNNFVLQATATLVLDVGGIYTFGINNDDGARLQIDGETVILDDTLLEAKVDHLGTIFLPAGTHTIDLVMFQLARNDGLELFYARGEYLDFNDRFLLLGASDGQPFAPSIGTDIEADMRGASGSVYARYPFLISAPENVQRLTLQLQYDDGFVAYLNGTEITRRNAPSTVDFASTATVAHPDRESLRAESIDLTPLRHLLQSGTNVLAIQGLNADVSNPDFLLAPSLRGSIVRERLVFDAPMEIRARLRIGETWSALTDARFHVAGAADDARQLAITEINYNPQPPSETEQSEKAAWRNDDFEFIELKNLGDHTIDLAGVGISQGITFTFPESGAPQLAPGAIAVVVRDRSAFEARYGTGLPVVGQF